MRFHRIPFLLTRLPYSNDMSSPSTGQEASCGQRPRSINRTVYGICQGFFPHYSLVDCQPSFPVCKERDDGGAHDSRVIRVVASSTRGLSRVSPVIRRMSMVV